MIHLIVYCSAIFCFSPSLFDLITLLCPLSQSYTSFANPVNQQSTNCKKGFLSPQASRHRIHFATPLQSSLVTHKAPATVAKSRDNITLNRTDPGKRCQRLDLPDSPFPCSASSYVPTKPSDHSRNREVASGKESAILPECCPCRNLLSFPPSSSLDY